MVKTVEEMETENIPQQEPAKDDGLVLASDVLPERIPILPIRPRPFSRACRFRSISRGNMSPRSSTPLKFHPRRWDSCSCATCMVRTLLRISTR